MSAMRATAAARQWVADKGWVVDDYRVAMSQVQSAPLGCVSVDVLCIRHEDADDARQLLQRSRVLELNAESWEVEAVLAARDPVALKRQLDVEHVRVETENMEHQRAEKQGEPGGGEDGAEDAEMGVSDLLPSVANQDPALRLEDVEEEIQRVRAMQKRRYNESAAWRQHLSKAALEVDKADTHWWEPKTETETEAETGVPPTEEKDALDEGAYGGND